MMPDCSVQFERFVGDCNLCNIGHSIRALSTEAMADQFAFALSSSSRVVKVIRYLMIQGIEGDSPIRRLIVSWLAW